MVNLAKLCRKGMLLVLWALLANSCMLPLFSECTGGSFFRDSDSGDIKCATQCEATTRCGTFTVPAQHLKVCSTLILCLHVQWSRNSGGLGGGGTWPRQ